MSAILKAAAAFVIGAAALASSASTAAPAAAAVSAIPVRVVPGMPKTVEACDSGGFTVTTAPHLGTAVTNAAGFVYTTGAGVTAGEDTLVGHCGSAAGAALAFRLTIAGKNPNPVRVGYAETCRGSIGTVVFTIVNSDSRRHTVSIASSTLSPHHEGSSVPAASTVSVSFGIGGQPARVSVRVDRGRPGLAELKGCPAGNGAAGVVPGRGGKTGGGFLARHPGGKAGGGLAARHPDPRDEHPQDGHALNTAHTLHSPNHPQAR